MSTGITVYSKPNCIKCNATYNYLNIKGADYKVVNVLEDDEAMAKIKGLGYLEAPVIITEDGTHWSGFQMDKLEAAIASA